MLFKSSMSAYRYEFQWILENFASYPSETKISTPYFSPIPGQDWCVELRKNKHVWAYICSKNEIPATVVYQSTLCDITGHVYFSGEKYCDQNGIKIDLLRSFNNPSSLLNLPNDILIFKCSLEFVKSQAPTVEMLDFEDNINAADQLLLNFKAMFEKSEHCDVTLKVDGVSIETHKTILCTSSPIFAKMFNYNVKETTSNTIDITDVSGPIMKKCIELLYCPILKEDFDLNTACDLYDAFDKYEVLCLRSMIGKEIIKLLNNENALEILLIADQHNDDCLKEKVIQYVRFHLKSIVNLDCWEKFVTNNSSLAAALITNYFKEFKI